MPETIALIGSYFAGAGAAAGTGAAVGTAAGAGAAVGTAGAVAGGAAAGAAGAGLGGTILSAAGTALATAAAGKLLEPKRPDLPSPTAMPDPMAQEEARRRSIIEQVSRRGRASTILTADAGGKLGG